MASHPNEEIRGKVEVLATAGVPHVQIARVLRVSNKTLYEYYTEELDLGLVKTVGNLSNTLVQKALNGDNTCLIFFLKTRGAEFGWREAQSFLGGKKESQQVAADAAASGRFAPAAQPKTSAN